MLNQIASLHQIVEIIKAFAELTRVLERCPKGSLRLLGFAALGAVMFIAWLLLQHT